MDVSQIPLIILIGIIAGFVGVTVGGCGFITIGGLTLLGVNPHLAIGAERIAAIVPTALGYIEFAKKGLLKTNFFPKYVVFSAMLGVSVGVAILQRTSTQTMQLVIPIVTLAMFFYKITHFKQGLHKQKPVGTMKSFAVIVGFGVGLYEGFLGMGSTTMFIIGISIFFGVDAMEASVKQKGISLFTLGIAALLYIYHGIVPLKITAILCFSYFIGAQIGINAMLKYGVKFINYLMTIMLFILSIGAIYQYYIL